MRSRVGFAYLSIRYTDKLAESGIEPSVGSIGDSYDNALAETINGLLETGIIYPNGPWCSLEEVEFATLEWVDRFNNRRLLGLIRDIPPVFARAAEGCGGGVPDIDDGQLASSS